MVIGLVQVEFKSDNTKFPLITVLFAIFEEPNITSKSKSSVSLVEFCVSHSVNNQICYCQYFQKIKNCNISVKFKGTVISLIIMNHLLLQLKFG